jgi:DNA-binding SARP family transcriptional activator
VTQLTHPVRVELLGGFRLARGADTVTLPHGSEHLLAFVALNGHAIGRTVVAGSLWPDADERRAHATLRSALTRLDAVGREALRVGHDSLSLAEGVAVDVHEARALALRLLDPVIAPSPFDLCADALTALSLELLPGWYDDWAVLEAEDWRQLRLHALEAMAVELTARGRFGEAAVAAATAINAEPLRESAHCVLIRVHLAEGNRSEALREYERFRLLLDAELHLEPTPSFRALVGI